MCDATSFTLVDSAELHRGNAKISARHTFYIVPCYKYAAFFERRNLAAFPAPARAPYILSVVLSDRAAHRTVLSCRYQRYQHLVAVGGGSGNRQEACGGGVKNGTAFGCGGVYRMLAHGVGRVYRLVPFGCDGVFRLESVAPSIAWNQHSGPALYRNRPMALGGSGI